MICEDCVASRPVRFENHLNDEIVGKVRWKVWRFPGGSGSRFTNFKIRRGLLCR
jgi:hypothetical protein